VDGVGFEVGSDAAADEDVAVVGIVGGFAFEVAADVAPLAMGGGEAEAGVGECEEVLAEIGGSDGEGRAGGGAEEGAAVGGEKGGAAVEETEEVGDGRHRLSLGEAGIQEFKNSRISGGNPLIRHIARRASVLRTRNG
jgi:hypothetical protein